MSTVMMMESDAADGIRPGPSVEHAIELDGMSYDVPSFHLGPIDLALVRDDRILIRQSVAFASDPLRCCPWMTVEHFALLARFYETSFSFALSSFSRTSH